MKRPVIEVLLVVQPNMLLLDLAGIAEVFRMASIAGAQQPEAAAALAPIYQMRFVGPQESALSSVGLGLGPIQPLPAAQDVSRGTWVVVSGCASASIVPDERGAQRHLNQTDEANEQIAHWLRTTLRMDMTLITICSGALVAARAGVLAGRLCTTHYEHIEELRQISPSAQALDNRVFVHCQQPGLPQLFCSAGVTTGIDLALHLVARTAGHPVALTVARRCVVFLRRGASDPQLSPLLAFRNHVHPAVHRAQDAVLHEPAADWSADQLANVAHVTPRHLARLFAQHAGISPIGYVEQIRLELARALLSQSDAANIERAALTAGFSSAQQLRRAWRKAYPGSSPSAASSLKTEMMA